MGEQNYPEARRKVSQILHTAPTNGVALALATSVGFWQKDCPAAKEASLKLLELYPKAPAARFSGFAADYICGHPQEARAAALEMFQHSPGQMSPYSIAVERSCSAAMPTLLCLTWKVRRASRAEAADAQIRSGVRFCPPGCADYRAGAPPPFDRVKCRSLAAIMRQMPAASMTQVPGSGPSRRCRHQGLARAGNQRVR